VVVMIVSAVTSGYDLGKIVFRLCSFCLILHSAKGWEKKANQNCDDGDNDKQLDQGKTASALLG